MVSIPKVVGLMSCGFVLCLGLSNAAQAGNATSSADEMKGAQSDRMKGDQKTGSRSEGTKTIKGEVLRVEGDNYFVKGQDGKEVRLHIDHTTHMTSAGIKKGDNVEASVNDQNHALSILSDANESH